MLKSIIKRQMFSSSWVWKLFLILFFLKKYSLHMLLMLFIHVEKRLNMRSQMFFTTGAYKYFAIFTGKHLCWSLFNKVTGMKACIFIKKDTPTQVLSYDHCKIFKNSLFMDRLFMILLRNFIWWWILDIWRLYFAILKLGHVAEITSR